MTWLTPPCTYDLCVCGTKPLLLGKYVNTINSTSLRSIKEMSLSCLTSIQYDVVHGRLVIFLFANKFDFPVSDEMIYLEDK